MSSSAPQQGPSVLFVCLGNICRSPMAEGVFRSAVNQPTNPAPDGASRSTLSSSAPSAPYKFAKIDSAGTGAYHISSPPDRRTLNTLRQQGITDYTHAARVVDEADFEEFDWIFAMDAENLEDLQDLRARVLQRGERRGKGGQHRTRAAARGADAAASAAAAEAQDATANKEQRFKARDGLAHVMLFGEFGGRSRDEEVGDPYYGGTHGFEAAFEQVSRFSRGFLKYLEGTRWEGDASGGP